MDATTEFDDALPPAARDLIARGRAFAHEVVAPAAAGWDHDRVHPREALRAASLQGLASVEISPAHGGLGLPFGANLRLVEEIAEIDWSFAFALINHHNAAARIANAGIRATIDRWLPPMLAGERLGASGLSEPEAGSDFASIRTRAERIAGSWTLEGAKHWVASARDADVFVTYAQTQPGARGRGIACFLVDAARAGFVRSEPVSMPGLHAAGIGGYRLQGYVALDAELLQPAGDAFKQTMQGVNKARAYIAAMAAGVVADSLRRALDWSGRREAFGSKLIEHQGLRWSLAGVATTLEAMRLLAYRAASLIDRGEDAVQAAAIAKKFAGENCLPAVAACAQALGARGITEDEGLTRQLAAARAVAYADGTTEMMNERIGAGLRGGR